jgi:hypothetical protein
VFEADENIVFFCLLLVYTPKGWDLWSIHSQLPYYILLGRDITFVASVTQSNSSSSDSISLPECTVKSIDNGTQMDF